MPGARSVALAVTIVVAIFLFVQLGALALVEPFQAAGYQPVEDPSDPVNSLLYVGAILLATVAMLGAFRYGVDQVVRLAVVGSGAWLSLYLFRVLLPSGPRVGPVEVVPVALAVTLGVALYAYPEWYVIDVAGAIMGAVAAGLFGIGFGVLPAVVLLSVLAVYDALSVYGTEHMLSLASGVMDLRVPVVLVIPLTLSYSFLDSELPDPLADADSAEGMDGDGNTTHGNNPDSDGPDSRPGGASPGGTSGDPGQDPDDGSGGASAADGSRDREALFIGLGDVVIPTVLVASAAFFAPDTVQTVATVPLPAVTAMAGTFLGLAGLLWLVVRGRAHAGLPLLNGGAIAGYLLGGLASGLTVVQALGLTPYV